MLNFAVGQLLAIDLAIIPVLAKWLGTIQFPGAIAQVGLGYFWMLFLLLLAKPWQTIANPLYLYLLLGVLDFESNFFISEAFGLIPPLIGRFMLSLALPFSFLFSLPSGRVPSSTQIMGVIAVIGGVVLAVVSPLTLKDRHREDVAKGLAFAAISALLGALSGVAQQTLMKKTSGKEFEMVGCMAISAVIVAAVQLPLYELDRYKELPDPVSALAGIFAISMCIFIFYSLSILYNRRFPGALPYNLLLINGYTFLADLVVFGNWEIAEPMLGGAFILTVGGGLVFHLATAELAATEKSAALVDEMPLLLAVESN